MLDRDPWGQIRNLPRILKEATMPITATEIASVHAQDALDMVEGLRDELEKLTAERARVIRGDAAFAKQAQEALVTIGHLRKALEEAAQRLEARGHNFGASEARRVLRDT